MDRDRLMTELIEVLDESARDAAWSPQTLLGYLAEGQEQFCEDTGYFVDKTNFKIDTVVGQTEYELDDRIIEVYDVYINGCRLGHVSQQSKDYGSHDSQYLIPNTSADNQPVREWQVDEQTGMLTLMQSPDSIVEMVLRVHRYPMFSLDDEDIDSEGHSAEPEIPRRFRRALIAFAASKALMHHDAEQQDPVKAAEHMREYTQYAKRGKRARIRLEGVRRGVAPSPVYQT